MGKNGRFLFATWDGGGNLQPALGLGRLLVSRGHSVRMLVWGAARERVEAAGCAFTPLLPDEGFDPSRGSAWEDQDDAFLEGLVVAAAVLEEVDRERPDILVVDFMLRSLLCAAERSGVPTVALVHTQRSFFTFSEADDPEGWGWDFDPVNETRVGLGLEPVPRVGERLVVQLLERCARALSVVPREFESPDVRLPTNARYVGPLFEENEEW